MSESEKPQTLLMALPVKGLHITDGGPIDDPFSSPWCVIGHKQFNQLERAFGSSFQSNIRQMRESAWPTAIFLFRYTYPYVHVTDAARRAEYALAGLSMAILLHRWPAGESDGQVANPRPVFRSRYGEYYDMPLGVSPTGVKVVGGGKSVFSLLRPDWIAPDRRISIKDLRQLIDDKPEVIAAVLNQEKLDRRQRRVADGMAVINGAFQTLSAGAFVSSLVSAVEVLVDSQTGGGSQEYTSSWHRRLVRIRALLGPECDQVLEKVLQARHDYVHSGEQPTSDRLPLAALGMAVEIWSIIAELYNRIRNAQDVEALIDAAAIAGKASADAPSTLRALPSELPAGVRQKLDWIDYWFRMVVEE